MAGAWRPFLPDNVTLNSDTALYPRYDGLHIYCDKNRRHALLFEEHQNPNGKVEQVCLTAIPGVDDPSTLPTWEHVTRTVAVYEIMIRLLDWNRDDTLQTWSAEKG